MVSMFTWGFLPVDVVLNSVLEAVEDQPFPAFLALIIAVGTVCRDLEPRLKSFWQSRPIPITHWFWKKYLTGLGIVFLAFIVPWASPA